MGILFFFTFLVLAVYVILLLRFRSAWQQIPSPADNPSVPTTRITVIIPARNEEKDLPVLLQDLLDQTYPADHFEVLVIDDHSTDRTADIVSELGRAHIRVISLADHLGGEQNSYKKKAIETGVSQSTGSLIVTTDADCRVPAAWLSMIAGVYESSQPAMMVMPVRMTPNKQFVEIFQALDFMSLQGITGAAMQQRAFGMCNGANLAYTKEAYQQVDGFAGISSKASGDDMMLLHKIQAVFPGKVQYVKHPDLVVSTAPMHDWRSFFNQRIRWASKSATYTDNKIKLVLLLVYLVNLLLLIFGLLCIVPAMHDDLHPFVHLVIMLVIKTVAELYFLRPVARFFGQSTLLWDFPFAQLFHIPYTVIAGWLGMFGSYQWKGRKVR